MTTKRTDARSPRETQAERSIHEIDPTQDPRWSQLTETGPSSLFNSPNWIRAVRDTYGWDASALILVDAAEEPLAGIPLFRLHDVRGPRIVSIPFSDYCDPIIREADDWTQLTNRLFHPDDTFILRTLHQQIPNDDDRLAAVKRARWHRVDLRPDVDALWAGLNSGARRAVRKAERDGVEITVATDRDSLRVFFDLHLGVRKAKYRLLAQPYRFFERIWDQFADQNRGWLILARHGEEIIGGIMLLAWKDTLYYKFNASLASELSRRQNDMLMWNTIQWAKSMGFDYLDLGLSDWDQEGLVRYKRKFASDEGTITFLQSRAQLPSHPATADAMRMLGSITQIMTDENVPRDESERAGDALYHLFA